MSNLDKYIADKQQKDDRWKERKAEEWEQLNTLSDAAIIKATTEPDAYLRYLDAQADNPRYSAGNVLMVLGQRKGVSVFNSLKGWNDLGRSVNKNETGLLIRVSNSYMNGGKRHQGFKVGRAFDISQTTGKDAPRHIIKENSREMETGLRKLLNLSPVKVVTSTTAMDDAFYDPNAQEIIVSSALTDGQTFGALAREIVHASIHNHGQYPYYSRSESALDAASVSYMLCRSFGIQVQRPDASHIAVMYDGMETKDRRGILNSLQSIFHRMQWEIQQEVFPQERKPEQARNR